MPQSEAAAPAAPVGHERWPVKTGTDFANAHASPALTTIAALRAYRAPKRWPPKARVAPVETTSWRVAATLTAFKQEVDGDYHLVLTDAQGETIIAEIPDPTQIADGTPCKTQIAAARATFDARFGAHLRVLHSLSHAGAPAPMITRISVPVALSGVGFFDRIHNASGQAPSGIEIHPVLSLSFATNAA